VVQRLFADRALIVLLAAAILCTACSMFTDASSGGGRCASVVRQAECRLSKAFRARFTFSKMSVAVAVQMKGLGARL
jgi:hypothetical protein